METKVSEVDELKEKIAARIAFLKKVTDFAMSITEERGEMFPSSTVTHINRRLLSFGRFSFMVDLDQLGINVVQIWFRPKIYIPDITVLNIAWEGTFEKCDLRMFRDDQLWQNEILETIKNRNKIADEINRVAAADAEKVEKEKKEQGELFALKEMAKRLKLI